MTWASRLWRRKKLERDLGRELQFHIAEKISALRNTGLSEEEARRQVRQEFGGIEQVKEECRDARGTRWIENLYRDIRFALRSLSRTLGFSLLAVAVLTLGIGATTAIFSITRTVLLKPLAYRDPGRLATLLFRVPQFAKGLSTIPVNAQHYLLWRDHSRTVQEVGLVFPDSNILAGLGPTEQISGVRITANFLHMLGVQPLLGRSFAPDEDQPGHNQVVIVSYDFWQNYFSGLRNALGRKILLDGQPYEVIGVMPPGLPFPGGRQLSEVVVLPNRTEYWRPLVFTKDQLGSPLGDFDFVAIGRLKPGVSAPQVVADLAALERVIAKRYPQPVEIDPVVRPLQAAMAREIRLPLLIFMGAVLAVLAVVCINLMNLMMVRATAQRRDWSIRLALGAGAGTLLRGAFTESLLLSVSGALLGWLLAFCLLRVVRLTAPVDLPRLNELALDPAALLLALGAAVATALLFGVWPAWHTTRINPQEAMQSSGRTVSESRKGHRTGKLLVALEVTLSTVLLLGAGLFLRSFATILGVNPGLNAENLLTVDIKLPPEKYQNDVSVSSFYQRLLEQTRVLPGAKATGLVSQLPVTPGENNSENPDNPVTAADRPTPPITQWPMANYRYASAGYFQAAGIPLKTGRTFTERVGDTREVIISENLAERLWPGQSAIGRPLKPFGDPRLQTVVGVVGAIHGASLTQEPSMTVYFPSSNRFARDMLLIVRGQSDPAKLISAIRRSVTRLEPEAAISSVHTMKEVLTRSLALQRFELMLLGSFATAALLLAAMGIYGVLAFATGRRTSEIGIRMAFGAVPRQILESTLIHGMMPVVAGIGVGLCLSTAFARIFQSLLFHVRALDPFVYAGTALAILAVASLACLVPARRAAHLNPVEALRHE
jgi:putative ABC transport system permease protein